MKQLLRFVAVVLLVAAVNIPFSTARAQGTAFTYQGQLQNNGSPASGTYNFQFSLYATNTNGTAIAGPVTNSAVAVSNGLFTTTIDFGASVWNGQTNWLQIRVETNHATSLTTLTPRQQVTPVPYATYAESANAAQLTGILNLSTPEITSGGNTLLYSSAGGGNFFAGESAGNPASDSGFGNSANGFGALNDNTSGSFNTANGYAALSSNLSGNENTAVGAEALEVLGNVSFAGGSSNIALGYQAGHNFGENESDNIDIGNQGVFGESGVIRIGTPGTQTDTYLAGTLDGATGNNNNQFLVNAPGGVGINWTSNPDSPESASLFVLGNNTNGWQNSVAWIQNNNTSTNIAPALRVINSSATGTNIDGALSVSANGPGLIAEFGNAFSFVVQITNNGTIYATAFSTTSDRNAKQDFAPVNSRDVLAKVAAMPITQWSFKTDTGTRHMGPMAQDFYQAFALGSDDHHIATVDEDGVALAAIQGLNQKLEEQSAENAALKQELNELKAEVKLLAQRDKN